MSDICNVATEAVVRWDLTSIANSVKDNCETALSIAPTLGNLHALKTARAQLNSDHRELDKSVSEMLALYMTQWVKFKADYDNSIGFEYKNADEVLKAEITELENQRKAEIAERLLDHIERIKGTRDEKYLPKILLSASEKSLIEATEARIAELDAPTIERVYILRGTEKEIDEAVAVLADRIEIEEV